MKINQYPVANTVGGEIAALWRRIVFDENLTNSLSHLVGQYLYRSKIKKQKQPGLKIKTKTVLETNICSPDMTWKTFHSLLTDILNVDSYNIKVSLTHHDGRVTPHATKAINNTLTRPVITDLSDVDGKISKVRKNELS